jgi:hypothetical protein
MYHARLSALLVFLCGLVTCTVIGSNRGTSAEHDPNMIVFDTGSFEVPVGESFQCFYTPIITDRELSIVSASAEQGMGGHHVTVYYVDHWRKPHRFACAGTVEMTDWHFVIGAGGEGQARADLMQLANGLAIKVPAGKQLLVQAHYINTSGSPHTENDRVRIKLTDPARVVAYAADFVINDHTFVVRPQAATESSMICTLPKETQLVMLLGHMHKHGTHYKLERVDEEGHSLEVLYEHNWNPSYTFHPPIQRYSLETPLRLAKGTRLRQTCKWSNTTSGTLRFPTEMCVGFGYYFPGNDRLLCEHLS